MNNIKEQAQYYRIGLPLGLFEVAEVISWCDSVIMSQDVPDIAIIEASILGSAGRDVIANHLAEVEGEVDRERVVRRLLRLMSDLLKNDVATASMIATAARVIADKKYLSSEEANSELWLFDSCMFEVHCGCFKLEDIVEHMLETLEKYAAPSEMHAQKPVDGGTYFTEL